MLLEHYKFTEPAIFMLLMIEKKEVKRRWKLRRSNDEASPLKISRSFGSGLKIKTRNKPA
jgi:hypothetical protein